MRIGLFSDTYPPEINGVANSTHILYKELIRHGHEVYVVTTGEGFSGYRWDEEHRVMRISGMVLKWLYNYRLCSPWQKKAMSDIEDLKLDVIHVQTEFGVGLFARICGKKLNIPLVYTYHTTYEDYGHYINFLNLKAFDSVYKKGVAVLSRMYADSAAEIIAPSEKTKQLLTDYHVKHPVSVIPTGLELDRFHPDRHQVEKTREIREKFGIPCDKKMVLYVGRIAEEKAIDLVIRGFAKAIKEGNDIYFLVIGLGPDSERLKSLAEALGVADHVILGGPWPNIGIPDIYRSADAFISASLTETQGMTFVEALASGLPLFARRDDVLKDLLIEEKTGWYFTDEEDLAQKLHHFADAESEMLDTMRENALRQVVPFSSEVFYESVMEVFERVVSNNEKTRIADIQVRDSYVTLHLEKGSEASKLNVSLDDYYQYNLSKDHELASDVLKKLKEKEIETMAYQRCLQRIAVKDRASGELRDWLKRNTECSEENIDNIIEKLHIYGYLDDERYTREKISQMKASLKGKDKIFYTLRQKGIDEEMARAMLDEADGDEEENAMRLAEKTAGHNTADSVNKLRGKLHAKLYANGFSSEVIERVVNRLDMSRQKENEDENLRRCAEKALHKYEKKFTGYELKTRVFRACLQQGFRSEEVSRILDEMRIYE